MKLSFSVRGWNELSWDDMVKTAEELRFQGIEVYNIAKHEELIGKSGPFHKYKTAVTARMLHDKKLRIPCIDSSCDISAAGTQFFFKDLRRDIIIKPAFLCDGAV